MRKLVLFSFVMALALLGPSVSWGKGKKGDRAIKQIDDQIAAAQVNKGDPGWRTMLTKPAVVLSYSQKRDYIAVLDTNKGDIRIKLLPNAAPVHVTNLIYLARLGFYDGLTFHRVVPGFMAQGGCPVGSGNGNPGYMFSGEPGQKVKFDRAGVLAAANSGPGTDGSQFFITFAATPWLDGRHTIYGEVVGGQDTLKLIEAVGSRGGSTSEIVRIEEMTIEVR